MENMPHQMMWCTPDYVEKGDIVNTTKQVVSIKSCHVNNCILWFSIHYDTSTASSAAARREIFGVNALRRKLHQQGSPNLQDIFLGGQASLGMKRASF